MTSKEGSFICYDDLGICCPTDPSSFYVMGRDKKPVEIYVFIDPLCPECWALEPIIKKLQMEYSNYFTITTFLRNEIRSLNTHCGEKYEAVVKEMAQSFNETSCRTGMPCDGDVWYENTLTTPYVAILAIKAAELQGKAIGIKYLRRVRESLFLYKQNIAEENVLIECASNVKGMDVEEFIKDLHSDVAKDALQSDMKAAQEMDVEALPTMIFFGDDVDEPGLKVQGLHSYDIYVEIISEILGKKPKKCPPVSLEQFVAFYSLVTDLEISVVFDMTKEQINKEMKKLQIKQVVEEIRTKRGSLWRYKGK
ncbi:DsbA family protein [Salipaludibacillus agaradhaerens]|uniref:ClpXP adapter protein SpxH n=1 Tax=Salipaludibacillus agaradhaerens TaxID=76935 RepID=A0A9Q4FXY0_SALAG|nr:ClpXP adapter SpxH family protein [Salipaludibacillus agaradhaerens]MCR6095791.1 DsbA family protein [Salipaludibacillus agaradhaerens]MCR6114649.1 DsbA family protein [Salipaludibacillus agaradhaerens]